MVDAEAPPQMSGYLDRRGMLNFWSRRMCVLSNNQFKVIKDNSPEVVVNIDQNTKVTLFDQNSPRFLIEVEGMEPIHLRAPDTERAMAWVLALRSCGFEHPQLSIESFHLISVIGRGFYGKVTLAQKNDTGELFAIKSIHKSRLIKSNKVHTVLTERNILSQACHPFIVSLFYAFQTKQKFDSFQLHIEWCVPENITGESQLRGNSGVFLQGLYEVQILDCYNNPTYVNGQTGSIYKQSIPLANAMRKPGEWNVYDIIYNAPTFKKDGSYRTHPTVTVIHNGVVLQNNTTILGTTEWIGFPQVKAHGAGPIILQSHGDPSEPISFRNIWIREL